MNNFEKYKFIKEKLNAPRFDNEDEEIDWFTKHLYGLYNQANRLREENNKYMARIDKQKEVLDKIKEKVKELDRFDPCGSMAVSMSISQFQEDLERLLEEIE